MLLREIQSEWQRWGSLGLSVVVFFLYFYLEVPNSSGGTK